MEKSKSKETSAFNPTSFQPCAPSLSPSLLGLGLQMPCFDTAGSALVPPCEMWDSRRCTRELPASSSSTRNPSRDQGLVAPSTVQTFQKRKPSNSCWHFETPVAYHTVSHPLLLGAIKCPTPYTEVNVSSHCDCSICVHKVLTHIEEGHRFPSTFEERHPMGYCNRVGVLQHKPCFLPGSTYSEPDFLVLL